MKSVAEMIAEQDAKKAQGNWMPGCGGTETPFLSRSGRRLLYCWQPSTGRHAYLDCGSDVILTDEEAEAALGLLLPAPVVSVAR
jgi:hypothetical protein